MNKTKPGHVIVDPECNDQLNEISKTRRKAKRLDWRKKNVIEGYIKIGYKKECKS